MGRKLDLSGLTETEAEHVLQVVQRDMRLRKKEEERLSELKQELDEEGSRCLLLSRQNCFNQRCCIRCCLPFTFLLNPKRQCCDCHYNVCKACRVFNKQDKAWLCSACQRSRLLKTQSLEWFYTNLKTRFKRFGSAKVLKTLYRKHLVEHSVLSEITESSAYEESICNEGSFCGSDSTFYRQTQEHSMAETITVALRVAEEAIDEAISKAEFDTASQEKQNEAQYLREHRAELIEELSKTIVQKIISRRKTLTDMRADYDQDWPLEHTIDLHHPQSDCDQASSSLKHQDLWRSHAAFSLLDDTSGLIQDSSTALKKDGGGSAWKSVDRLDNAVLKSPDGNWIALQSAQLSRPSLLARRKSLVFSALEKESEVLSPYEVMDSDSGAKLKSDTCVPTSLMASRENLLSDSEANWESNKSAMAVLKSEVPKEKGRPSSSRRTSIIDVNFNVGGAGEEEDSKVSAMPDTAKVRRSRKKRRNKKELSSSVGDYSEKDHSQNRSDTATPDTLTSGATTPEHFPPQSDITDHKKQPEEADGEVRDAGTDDQREEKRRGSQNLDDDEVNMETDEGRTEEDEEVDEEMKYRLYRLITQSRLTYLSTDDDLDKVGQSEGEWGGDKDEDREEEKTDRLNSTLCELEKEVQANQFSSTEDELDRVSVTDEDKTGEELAVKVCRLAHQTKATQFSSTEDELDQTGRGEEGEEGMDEEELWELQAEKEARAAQLRDLARLVSVSQFSSTEDELDRVGENEMEINEGDTEQEAAVGKNLERGESFGDLDVVMFDLKDESEEKETKVEDVQQLKVSVEEKKDCMKERVTDEDERMTKQHMCEEKELLKEDEAKKAKETEEKQEKDNTKRQKQEAKRPVNEEAEERQEEEFDRIISSMLLMDLDDMQVETLKAEAENNGSINREPEANAKTEAENGFKNADDAQRTDASEETGSAKEFESKSDDVTPESTDRERTVENRSKQNGDISRKNGRNEKAKVKDARGKNSLKITDKQKEDRKVKTEWETIEIKEEATERNSETKESHESLEENTDTVEQWFSLQEDFLAPKEIQNGRDKTIQFISALLEQRYSAVSLRSITTEVLKVLNATEELLLQGEEGEDRPHTANTSLPSLPPNTDPKELDQRFSRLEENVYVAAGQVYSLEAELSDLEECARGICSDSSDMELSFLEEQVASAAAKVQQSELQVCDISARIAALKSAGLNVDTQQSRFNKTKTIPAMPVTADSRQLRRRLPAPPVKGDKEET